MFNITVNFVDTKKADHILEWPKDIKLLIYTTFIIINFRKSKINVVS